MNSLQPRANNASTAEAAIQINAKLVIICFAKSCVGPNRRVMVGRILRAQKYVRHGQSHAFQENRTKT